MSMKQSTVVAAVSLSALLGLVGCSSGGSSKAAATSSTTTTDASKAVAVGTCVDGEVRPNVVACTERTAAFRVSKVAIPGVGCPGRSLQIVGVVNRTWCLSAIDESGKEDPARDGVFAIGSCTNSNLRPDEVPCDDSTAAYRITAKSRVGDFLGDSCPAGTERTQRAIADQFSWCLVSK